MQKLIAILAFSSICILQVVGQESDSLPTNSYHDKIVLYSDLGFKAAPFTLHDDFPEGFKKLSFKHNFNPLLGIGIAYKWFGFRLGFGIPLQLKPVSRYGRSNYTDIGVKFNIKQTFWDLDFRNYRGYVIKDAYKWNDTLNELKPNDVRARTSTASFSINSWYFRSKKYKMQSVFGLSGDFNQSAASWYFKSTFSVFGVANNGDSIIPNRSIIPFELTDTTDRSKASAAFAIDLGLVPGYAYTFRKDNWQTSVFAGLGAVLQAKSFTVGEITRSFIGLAPRVDFRFITGYSKPRYFFWLVTDFDFKSIRYQEMRFNQTYYSMSIVGGIRLNKKEKEKKKKRKG